MRKNKYFFLGLTLLYLGLFFSKNWQTYFLGFFACGIFFYLQFKSIAQTVFLISVASIPYSVGVSRSQAISEASGLTSSYGLIPFTLATVFLSIYLFLKKELINFKKADIVLLIFYFYAILGFIVQNYYFTSLYGLAQMTIIVLYYFVARSVFQGYKILHYSIWILMSIAFYESILAVTQFILQSPIGIFAEEYVRSDPYGVVSAENLTLFRSSGTLSHPNNLGALLVMLLPAILYSRENSIFKKYPFIFVNLLILISGAVFVTYSRVSIALALMVLSVTFITNFKNIITSYKRYILYVLIIIMSFIAVLAPGIIYRLSTIPEVLDPGNTLDARVKVIQEAFSQVIQSPIFGVGINRFIEIASAAPTTDLFDLVTPSKLGDIHNLFIQMATGLGVPGLGFFMLFIFFLWNEFRKKIRLRDNKVIIISSIAILIIILESMMIPIFTRPLMRLFFLLAAILVSA